MKSSDLTWKKVLEIAMWLAFAWGCGVVFGIQIGKGIGYDTAAAYYRGYIEDLTDVIEGLTD